MPEAWRLVLDANTTGDHTAGHDMLGSINAHVQHDMPSVVARTGLRTPSGRSRKPDHDRVNRLLSRAYDDIVPAVGRRYDPFMLAADGGPSPVDDLTSAQLVAAWREGVWRLVATSIDRNAAAWSRLATTGQIPDYRSFRDAYCRARRAGRSVEEAVAAGRRAWDPAGTRGGTLPAAGW